MEVEPGVDLVEVVTGEFSDARQSVAKRAAMNVECRRGFVIVSAAFQVIAESQDQFGVPFLVVVQQYTQPFAHEGFDRAAVVGGVDDAIETEFVERRFAFRIGRGQHRQPMPSPFDIRASQNGYCELAVGRLGPALAAGRRMPTMEEFDGPRRKCMAPVGSAPVVQTNDIDEAREFLGRAYLPLELNPIGGCPLDLQMSAAELGVLTTGYVQFGGEVTVHVPDVHSYHVDIPLSGQARNEWDDGHRDIAVASASAGVFTPDMPVDIMWSPGCRQICLMVPAQEMRRQLETMLDQPVLAAVEFERSMNLKTPSSARWLELVTILMREANRPDGVLGHRLAKDNLQHLIIQYLLLMQPHSYTEALRSGERASSVGVVGRAIELIRTYPEASWTTAKLAQKTGLSARALQKSFARAGEMPPMTYLRYIRLHRAYAEFLNADPGSVTVTAVASRWGFLHFGRFAEQYYQQFGELPSVTLRRRNGRAGR
jgi:AraC-like DNA-binding protein